VVKLNNLKNGLQPKFSDTKIILFKRVILKKYGPKETHAVSVFHDRIHSKLFFLNNLIQSFCSAQRLSFGRVTVTPYDIKDLLDQLKTRRRSPSSVAGPACSPMVPYMNSIPPCTQQLLSGYLSVAVDQASGFHRDCNVWVALETDFYGQFTTQARTRIASTRASDRRIGTKI